MSATKTRTRAERESHLARVADMLQRRVPQTRIAEELGIARSQVSYDKKILLKRWISDSRESFEETVAEDLRGIIRQERAAWEMFVKSCEERVTITQTIEDAGEGTPAVKRTRVIKTEQSSGDPRYLNVLHNLRDQRGRFKGIAGNTNVQINVGSEAANINAPPSASTYEEWLEQNRQMEAATGTGLLSVPAEHAEFAEIPEPGTNGNGRHNGNVHE